LRRLLAIAGVCGLLGVLGACGQILASQTDDDAGAGTASGEGGAIDGAFADVGSTGCPSGRGPAMVLVELKSGPRFCIDSTEVTRAQYEAFLQSEPQPGSQVAACKVNDNFRPSITLDAGEYPAVGVDWCDAVAFCAWAGKRLCGELDGGGALPLDAATSFQRSEWTAACTRFGTASNSNSACNTQNEAGAWPAGSNAACTGGYDGIFDMIGNVTEWENACVDLPDGGRRCADRGGSFKAAGGCSFASIDSQNGFAGDWGIRCCASVP
jgi:formylglycine-generating enzyme